MLSALTCTLTGAACYHIQHHLPPRLGAEQRNSAHPQMIVMTQMMVVTTEETRMKEEEGAVVVGDHSPTPVVASCR